MRRSQVLFVCLNAKETQVDENLDGLESFEATNTIPTYNIKSEPLLDLLLEHSKILLCPDGTKCLGLQSCCYTGSHYSCCLYPYVRFSILNFWFSKLLINIIKS